MLRILSYNVHHCRGRDGIVSPSRVAQVIAACEPDIVALQEVDVGRRRSDHVDQAMAIAAALNMNSHFHPAMAVMEELYGDAILTALPSRLIKAGPLPTSRGFLGLEPRGALWAAITLGDIELQILNTHLGLVPEERAAQSAALSGREWIGHPQFQDPAIVLGDLNTLRWGRSRRRLIRALAGSTGAARAAATPPTFPSRYPVLSLDHIITSPSIKIETIQAIHSPLARKASDHLPLMMDFSIPSADPNMSHQRRALNFASE